MSSRVPLSNHALTRLTGFWAMHRRHFIKTCSKVESSFLCIRPLSRILLSAVDGR